MPNTQPLPATDSARELHGVIGDDATATFEDNPTFVDSDPTSEASSENLQEPANREQYLASPAKPGLDDEEEDEDEEDEGFDEDDEDDDLEDDDEDEDEDLDDEDEDDDEDYEDEDEDEDDDEDEDEDDDVEELEAAPAFLRADGALSAEAVAARLRVQAMAQSIGWMAAGR